MRWLISLLVACVVCLTLVVYASGQSAQLAAPNGMSGSVAFESFTYSGVDASTNNVSRDTFLNPILAGFYPDPSICRVGDDYYLVNSTFGYFPGIPIFHSRDLVHWKQIGNVLDRASQAEALRHVNVSTDGVYAPTIRYHAGRFYLICTQVRGGGGNFILTADRPEGRWSDPIWFRDLPGIDPSLFFDEDGRSYVVHNAEPPENPPLYNGHRAIWLQEVDLATGKLVGQSTLLINGGVDISKRPVWIEGPHLFKKDGWYILIAAEGGTGENHSEVVFRSRTLRGPYEAFAGNPILTQRQLPANRDSPITCVGHADFVELPNGDWWAVFLGCRTDRDGHGFLGRETFLLPVKWRDGWPIILENDAKMPLVLPRPLLAFDEREGTPPTTGTFTFTDQFNASALDLGWMTPRTPLRAWWSIERGSLLIDPQPVMLTSRTENPSFLCRRLQHAAYSAETILRVDHDTKDCDVGVAVFQDERHHFFLGVRVAQGTARELFLERTPAEGSATSSGPQTLETIQVSGNTGRIALRVRGAERSISFEYRLRDDADWTSVKDQVDATLLSTRSAGGFTGVCVGLHARQTK